MFLTNVPKSTLRLCNLGVAFLLVAVRIIAQCTGPHVSYFPVIVSGVTITQTYTGDVTYAGASNTWSNCGVTSGPTTLGNAVLAGSPFMQVLNFSTAVNNVVYILTAPDSTSYACETFTFSVDAGALTCTQGGSSCPLVQTGNAFRANSTNTIGTYITLNSTQPYSQIVVSGSGGANGSCMSLCQNSIGINDQFYQSRTKIYVDPARNLFIAESLENTNLSIYNSVGELIISKAFSGTIQIDARDLMPGVYFARYVGKDNSMVQKFVLN